VPAGLFERSRAIVINFTDVLHESCRVERTWTIGKSGYQTCALAGAETTRGGDRGEIRLPLNGH
jgi:hypothetical protein